MKLTSYGAALEVTGSQHLLEVNGKKILLDCGLFQGRRKEAHQKNVEFGFDPTGVDAMILSHAHIDHSGNIPNLIKQGFEGAVYCTEATKDLCDVMLRDSAHIQEADAKYFARKRSNTALPIEPLYTMEDAEYALGFLKGMPFGETFTVFDGIQVTFQEAGHVLGSAIVIIDIEDQEDGGKQKRFVFTGDLGRIHLPIINDPYPIEKADYILCESTYGNRTHAPIEEGIPDLARVINRTVRRGGKIIIPAFALERTQELVYALHLLIHQNEIPKDLSIFLDSPLANSITNIFKTHIELYDEEIRGQFKNGKNPFQMRQLKQTASAEESKKLNYFIGPCVIVSASGMCEAGRIRHHLKNNIEDPKNSIVIVGYMAENTLGRKLIDNMPMVKIFDNMYSVRAEVVVLESFSAHADCNDLDDYIKNIEGLKKIILVHGEQDQSTPMAARLKKATGTEVIVSNPKKTIEL